jgi:hypothetical protein
MTGELVGHPESAGVSEHARQRYALAVVSVRPDSAGSLVYRIRLQVPAYVPPGTYTFAIGTPFGVRHAKSAVRVLAGDPAAQREALVDPVQRGQQSDASDAAASEAPSAHAFAAIPRIAQLPQALSQPPEGATSLPVDLWLPGLAEPPAQAAPEPSPEGFEPAERAALPMLPPPRAAAPMFAPRMAAFALRVGTELWVQPGCADPRAFEAEVSALVRAEQRKRVPLASALRASLPAIASAAELSHVAARTFRSGVLELDNRDSARPRELSLLLPFAASAAADHGRLEWFPASDPALRTPEDKLARWLVPARTLARLRLGSPPTAAVWSLEPAAVRSGEPVRVRVRGSTTPARAAFAFGFARSALGSDSAVASFAGPLAPPVRAQVFSADGAGAAVHAHIRVLPQRPPSCSASPGRPRASSGLPGLCVLAGLLLLGRRARPPARVENVRSRCGAE